MPARSLPAQDVPSANPVAPSRSRRLGAGDRGTEGALLFGYFLLGKQEKVTRSPAGERKRLPRSNGSRPSPGRRRRPIKKAGH